MFRFSFPLHSAICVAGESFNVRISRSAFPNLTKHDLVLGDLELGGEGRVPPSH